MRVAVLQMLLELEIALLAFSFQLGLFLF